MRTFDYDSFRKASIPNDVVMYLSQINEYKGKQQLFYKQKSDILEKLVSVAKIQSTASSNRIEGIFTTDKRLQELTAEKVAPRNRDEKEILGYRFCLDMIHESHDYIKVTPNYILQFHGYLYRYLPTNMGGYYKNTDNTIEETDADGKAHVRFKPVTAFETPQAMTDLCAAYNHALEREVTDSLIVNMQFVLDFLCIHPFIDGNGRMSRLLTLLVLYRSGYFVGKYISLESMIEKSKDSYYDALQASSQNWHENRNDSWEFIRYMLGIILAAYREFENRIVIVTEQKMTKEDRVRMGIEETIGLFTKAEIHEKYPDISLGTIERVIAKMRSEEIIIALGTGRSAKWKRK